MRGLAGSSLGTALLLSAAALVALAPASSAAPPRSPATSAGLHASGYEGGGFQNTVAIGPSGTWLSGGDVAGISRSVDGGRTWAASNTGLTRLSDLRVASIVYAPTSADPRRVLAGVGWSAGGGRVAAGALLESPDDGVSWKALSTEVRFSGVDVQERPGSPRATGHLLVSQPDGTLLAGTYDRGVLRSADGGTTWQPVGVGAPVRSLVARPSAPDELYAADATAVWRSTGSGGATSFQQLPGSPTGVEELSWVAGRLYAAGSQGLHRLDGSRWVRLGGSTLPVSTSEGPVWTSLVGYRACGRTVLYAGRQTGGPDGLVRSVDGGRTWSSAVRSAVPEVGGPGGHRWWLSDRPSFMLGGSSYTAAQLALPRGSGCDRPVVVAGRSGLWTSTAPGSAAWYPAVGRLGVTVVNSVAVDPHDPQRTLAASYDWPLVASTDGFGAVSPFQPGKGTTARTGLGTAVAFDASATPSTAYLAAGEAGHGEVYTSARPTDPGSWQAQGLVLATGGGVVSALHVQAGPGGTVVLAAVSGSGIWRRQGAGGWTLVPDSPVPDVARRLGGSFAGSADGTVYFLDPQSGLYRSPAAGAGPWTLMWRRKSPEAHAEQIAVDPTTPGRLYVSAGSGGTGRPTPGLCRVDGAASAQPDQDGVLACTPVVASATVGPVQVDPRDGSVLVTRHAGPDGAAQLCRSAPGGSGPWSDVGGSAFQATGGFASSMALGADGTVSVALAGDGVLTGTPGPGSGTCAGT